jgi:hypothetical protein
VLPKKKEEKRKERKLEKGFLPENQGKDLWQGQFGEIEERTAFLLTKQPAVTKQLVEPDVQVSGPGA